MWFDFCSYSAIQSQIAQNIFNFIIVFVSLFWGKLPMHFFAIIKIWRQNDNNDSYCTCAHQQTKSPRQTNQQTRKNRLYSKNKCVAIFFLYQILTLGFSPLDPKLLGQMVVRRWFGDIFLLLSFYLHLKDYYFQFWLLVLRENLLYAFFFLLLSNLQVFCDSAVDSVLHIDNERRQHSQYDISYFVVFFLFAIAVERKKYNTHSSSLQRTHTKYARAPKWLIAHTLTQFLFCVSESFTFFNNVLTLLSSANFQLGSFASDWHPH